MTPDIHTLVGPYALDALEPAERQQFEQHLAVCDVCWAEVLTAVDTAQRLDAVRPRLGP